MRSILFALCVIVIAGAAANAAETETPRATVREDDAPVLEYRRDPFVMSLAPSISHDTDKPIIDFYDQQCAQIQSFHTAARRAFEEQSYVSLLHWCDQTLDAVKVLGDKFPERIQQIVSETHRFRKVAENLTQRDAAEKAFAALPLSVTGVIAQPTGACAIVNGAVIKAGAFLPVADELLQVERIEPDQVILRYHGFKVAAAVKSLK